MATKKRSAASRSSSPAPPVNAGGHNGYVFALSVFALCATERGGLSGAIFLRLSARELRAALRTQIVGVLV